MKGNNRYDEVTHRNGSARHRKRKRDATRIKKKCKKENKEEK